MIPEIMLRRVVLAVEIVVEQDPGRRRGAHVV